MQPPLLAAEALTRRFGGTLALDAVDLALEAGEIRALLGENGAGKSTLIKILAGVHARDAGRITMDGVAVEPMAGKLPIAFVHQELGLVDGLSVAENIALYRGFPLRRGLIDWPRVQREAREVLELMAADLDPDMKVGELPAAERALIGIARGLASKARLLVLDEPTAALPASDVERLHAALRRLKREGLGILYVTHRLDEVAALADSVTVLRDGRHVATRPVAGTTSAMLAELIVGRSLDELFQPPPGSGDAAPLLELDRLELDGVGPVSMTLHEGEILALVGLRGAGHHELGRFVFGAVRGRGGVARLAARPWRPASPAAATAGGVGFVSSRRVEESLAPGLAVRENLFMNPPLTAGRARINDRSERSRAASAMQRLAVRPAEPEQPVLNLSGGNQQKVVIARWVETGMRLLVLEEPTFGVDVGAKAEIYRILDRLVGEGRAVLLISSDFEEVAGIAHRALVLDRGRITAEVPRERLSVPLLTRLAGGEALTGAAA